MSIIFDRRHGFGALGLGDAAGERDHRPRAVLAAQPTDVGIGFLRGFLADVAGVEDDQVGVVAVGGRRQAVALSSSAMRSPS